LATLTFGPNGRPVPASRGLLIPFQGMYTNSMRHFFLSLAVILLTLFPLSAQDSVSSGAKGPLFPLYLSAIAGGGSTVEFRWRPDWPPSIPPDAFKTATPAVSLKLPQDKESPRLCHQSKGSSPTVPGTEWGDRNLSSRRGNLE